MIAGLSGRTERDPTAFLMVFYFRMRAAWILWQQRRKAGLAAHYAAACVGIDEWKLRRYELGIDSPPLWTIHRLLTRYNADEAAIFFFCTIPFPAPGIVGCARLALARWTGGLPSRISAPVPEWVIMVSGIVIGKFLYDSFMRSLCENLAVCLFGR